MEFQVRCECGRAAVVTEGDAGAQVPCPCGRSIAVPSLVALRAQAGPSAAGASIVLILERLRDAGDLPDDGRCVVCGLETAGLLSCTVECERSWSRGSAGDSWLTRIFLFLISPWLLLLVLLNRRTEEQQLGRDVVFALPLRLCGGCRPGSLRPDAVKDLLRRVEIYGRLLDRYPDAKVRAEHLDDG
jgi:hypothetical protein